MSHDRVVAAIHNQAARANYLRGLAQKAARGDQTARAKLVSETNERTTKRRIKSEGPHIQREIIQAAAAKHNKGVQLADVIHHASSDAERTRAVKELERIYGKRGAGKILEASLVAAGATSTSGKVVKVLKGLFA